MGLHVLGTGSALPARSVTNDDLSEFLDTSDEWISTRTGIRSRRYCAEQGLTEEALANSVQIAWATGGRLVPAEVWEQYLATHLD